MNKTRFEHNEYGRRRFANLLISCSVLGLSAIVTQASGENPKSPSPLHTHIEYPFIVTQIPIQRGFEQEQPVTKGMFRANFGDGARLVKVYPGAPKRTFSRLGKPPDLSTEVLSRSFHSACDPEISFDASHILFAGKRTPTDNWTIFEMAIDGSNIRQVTNGESNCRSPGYQATLYTIVSPKPWYQLTFVGSENPAIRRAGLNEYGAMTATNLYSCKLDGSAVRRLTYNLSSDMDPFIMPDGRLLFASWSGTKTHFPASRFGDGLNGGCLGRISLFAISIDGTDYSAFCINEGKQIKYMPCTTTKGLAVFIEADRIPWDGAGSVGSVQLRRPLHSYRPITRESDGLFHSPSPLPDGKILISRRSPDSMDTHGVYRLDPATGQLESIFDSPDYHDIQAKVVYLRPEPDGRSSVVTEKDPYGKLYCLNIYISDLDRAEWMSPGTVKRLRVLEGISSADDIPDPRNGISPLVQRRILGEISVEQDGSFSIEIPANTPIQLQTLDADGMALRSCSWIWAKNHEPRGCIGCHEDGELTPENIFVKAVSRPPIKLTLPPQRRRTVDFRRDIMPIIAKKCVRCHGKDDSTPRLTHEPSLVTHPRGEAYLNRSYEGLLAKGSQSGCGKYVHPGRARTSPLIWHIFGRNTSRPWDNTFSQQKVPRMPPDGSHALTEDEKRTFVEWIDMGALWDGIPGPDNLPGVLPGYKQNGGGSDK
ncbi:MAG: HzsA-related protein [Planctomycetota bacterium]